jgi:uncharacterized protein YecT (DUF1311 family)
MIRLATLFTLLAGAAAAQDIDCANAVTQRDMNFCAEREWQEADTDLNLAYTDVMAEMKEIDATLPDALQGAAATLRDAQRAWIVFRDANCAASGFMMRGGSAEALLIYGCMRQMTVNRTEELRLMNPY